jgi:hypothetical protein
MLNKTIVCNLVGGDIIEKEIYELDQEEGDSFKLLGRAVGISIQHCLALGVGHKADFWNRVYGYRIVPNGKTGKTIEKVLRDVNKFESYITVEFYEE